LAEEVLNLEFPPYCAVSLCPEAEERSAPFIPKSPFGRSGNGCSTRDPPTQPPHNTHTHIHTHTYALTHMQKKTYPFVHQNRDKVPVERESEEKSESESKVWEGVQRSLRAS